MCLKKFMVGNPPLTVDVEVEEDFDESEVEMEEDFEADGKNDSKDDKLCDLYVKYCTVIIACTTYSLLSLIPFPKIT